MSEPNIQPPKPKDDRVSRASRVSIAVRKSMTTSRMNLRRKSYGFGGVSGIKPLEKTSQIAIEFRRPALVYLPTYRLESLEPFHVERVQILVKQAISANFSKHKYHGQDSPALALRLAGEIMRSVKSMCFDRYRIICVVTIGQKRAQCYSNAVSFIWDHERDNYVEDNAETSTAFIQVIVFGVYLD